MMPLYRVECRCEKKKGIQNSQVRYLGGFDTDYPTGPKGIQHYCTHCNTTYNHTVDFNGLVIRNIIENKIEYPNQIGRVNK